VYSSTLPPSGLCQIGGLKRSLTQVKYAQSVATFVLRQAYVPLLGATCQMKSGMPDLLVIGVFWPLKIACSG
jgi:hypothetical protein